MIVALPTSYAVRGCDKAVSHKGGSNALYIHQREFLLGLELTEGDPETFKKAF